MKFLAAALILLVFLSGCSTYKPTEPSQNQQPASPEDICKQAGGKWNDCSSPCLGEPSTTVCIQVCVPQCECGGPTNLNCPEGYQCRLAGEGQNEFGACVKAVD